jgi:hypothetical protein
MAHNIGIQHFLKHAPNVKATNVTFSREAMELIKLLSKEVSSYP